MAGGRAARIVFLRLEQNLRRSDFQLGLDPGIFGIARSPQHLTAHLNGGRSILLAGKQSDALFVNKGRCPRFTPAVIGMELRRLTALCVQQHRFAAGDATPAPSYSTNGIRDLVAEAI